jgi:hypothetical protein
LDSDTLVALLGDQVDSIVSGDSGSPHSPSFSRPQRRWRGYPTSVVCSPETQGVGRIIAFD